MTTEINDITSLRAELFATIKGLRAGTLDVEKAKVINDTAQVIVNSAKVEVDYMKMAGGSGSGFLPNAPALPAADRTTPTQHGTKTVTHIDGHTVTRHNLK